jgi:hypothetical protein
MRWEVSGLLWGENTDYGTVGRFLVFTDENGATRLPATWEGHTLTFLPEIRLAL